MSDLLNRVISYEPIVSGVSVPLKSNIIITLSGLDYDEDSLLEGFFLEGPSADRIVGPGFLTLEYPEGIPYEDTRDILDTDFDYTQIVETTATITTGIHTIITLEPTYPLNASSIFRANLTNILRNDGVTEVSGFVTWPFTTGTGSIEELPEDISSSVLATTVQASAGVVAAEPLKVIKTTPSNHAIQQLPSLEEIEIVFNKPLDATSVTSDRVVIQGIPATDHPNISISSSGTLYKAIEVDGTILKLKI